MSSLILLMKWLYNSLSTNMLTKFADRIPFFGKKCLVFGSIFLPRGVPNYTVAAALQSHHLIRQP